LPHNENVALKDEITSLREKLVLQNSRYNDELHAAENDRKEIIALRSRLEEYERGVYGLADAMYAYSFSLFFFFPPPLPPSSSIPSPLALRLSMKLVTILFTCNFLGLTSGKRRQKYN